MDKFNIIKKVATEKDINDLVSLYGIDNIDIALSCRYLIGQNAKNNWNIYKSSQQSDTIFHLDKFSSSYIILNVKIDQLTKKQINTAALLCKFKSKYKNLNNISVLYTSISNTFLGDEIGTFIIKSNRKKKIIKV